MESSRLGTSDATPHEKAQQTPFSGIRQAVRRIAMNNQAFMEDLSAAPDWAEHRIYAPEQVRVVHNLFQTDIYMLCALLYELLPLSPHQGDRYKRS